MRINIKKQCKISQPHTMPTGYDSPNANRAPQVL